MVVALQGLRSNTVTSFSTEKYVYFHIRFGPVYSCRDFRVSCHVKLLAFYQCNCDSNRYGVLCLSFQSGDFAGKQELVRGQLIAQLSRLLNRNLPSQTIQDDAFGCGQLDHLIVYRGRLLGGDDYSALGLVELMQSWISTRQAFLTVDAFRMLVDPGCTTRLDTINAPDCPLTTPPPMTTPISSTTPTTATTHSTVTTSESTPPTTPTTTTSKPEVAQPQVSAMRGFEVGGVVIGALIVVLLLVLLLVIVLIVLYRSRKQTKKALRSLR